MKNLLLIAGVILASLASLFLTQSGGIGGVATSTATTTVEVTAPKKVKADKTRWTHIEYIEEQQQAYFAKYGEYQQVLSTRTLPKQAKRGFLQAGFDEKVVPDGYAIDVWDGPNGKGYRIRPPSSVVISGNATST